MLCSPIETMDISAVQQELESMTLPQLKSYAEELGLQPARTKNGSITRILNHLLADSKNKRRTELESMTPEELRYYGHSLGVSARTMNGLISKIINEEITRQEPIQSKRTDMLEQYRKKLIREFSLPRDALIDSMNILRLDLNTYISDLGVLDRSERSTLEALEDSYLSLITQLQQLQ